ncbi:Type II secretion system protein C, partial [Dissostichus eleginoides]
IQRCNSSQRFSALTAVTRQHFKVEQEGAGFQVSPPSVSAALSSHRTSAPDWLEPGRDGRRHRHPPRRDPAEAVTCGHSHTLHAYNAAPGVWLTVQLSGQRDRGKKPSMYSQASPYSPTIQTASCSAVLLSAGSSQ